MVRLTDCLDMTIAVDWDIKPQFKQKYKVKGVLISRMINHFASEFSTKWCTDSNLFFSFSDELLLRLSVHPTKLFYGRPTVMQPCNDAHNNIVYGNIFI